mmetsp:Transcript_3756/g.12238  ORF Transcript_3756/g.12238 Transcript_3756/m.12238 type:complete len:404 (-) Transcript_3756:626-1837(-)
MTEGTSQISHPGMLSFLISSQQEGKGLRVRIASSLLLALKIAAVMSSSSSSFEKPFTVATVAYTLLFAVTTYASTASANVRTGALLLALALPAMVASDFGSKSLVDSWQKEFVGTAVMVAFTCSPGPAVGYLGFKVEWIVHWMMMALADYSCGGPQVNPAVTCALYASGGFGFTPVMVLTNVCAQVAGGVLGWLSLYGSSSLFHDDVGGPSPDERLPTSHLFCSEFLACFILLAGVFSFATTKPFAQADARPAIYGAKMTLINATVRTIIVFVGATGPAINPALATSFAFVDANSTLPALGHYLIYWVGGCLGAVAVGLAWKALYKTESKYDAFKISVAVSLALFALFIWITKFRPAEDEIFDQLLRDQWNDKLKSRHFLSKLFKRVPKNATPPPGVVGAKLA